MTTAKVDRLANRCRDLTAEIENHSTDLTDLYAKRLSVWQEMVALGCKHREIAAFSRVRTVTVSAALAKAARR